MPKKGSKAQSRTLSLSQGKAESSVCGVCCQAVTPGKDEALFCEGACKRLMHRFCASITEEQYQELTAKKAEFLCPTCCRAKQQLEIDTLSSEVAMLKLELAQLKEAVTVLSQKQKQNQAQMTVVADTYASRAAQKAGCAKKGGNGAGAASRSARRESSEATVPTSSQKSVGGIQTARRHEIEREKVPGARRVWGTLKSTTPGAISSALKKLTTVGSQVTIKRKHRQLASGHTRWWFVLRSEEEVLTQLEGEWERVGLQLAWKLEPCFMPKQDGSLTRETNAGSNMDLTVPTSPVIVSSPIVSVSSPIVIANSDVQAPVNSPDLQTPVILPCTSDCSIHSTLSGSTAVTPDDSTESSTLPENH